MKISGPIWGAIVGIILAFAASFFLHKEFDSIAAEQVKKPIVGYLCIDRDGRLISVMYCDGQAKQGGNLEGPHWISLTGDLEEVARLYELHLHMP
ncbi:MAG TPA: hypothetical protein VGC58_02490 [Candidatus Paceibacterota bacterium]